MRIAIIKLNENTLEINVEREEISPFDEYKDKEILYEGDNTCIVCKFESFSDISYYKKLLVREVLNETSKELADTYKELSDLNRKYIGLVNKLI